MTFLKDKKGMVKRKELEAEGSADENEPRQQRKDTRGVAVGGFNSGKKSSGTFQTMGLHPALLKAVQRKGFRLPTPIQRKCILPLLEGRDVVGMARTGSGKTAAFVLPLLQSLRSHSAKVGIRGLVLSPSRELALQTFSVIKDFAKLMDLRAICLVGGDSVDDQFSQLVTNPDIVVATPGRLMHICVEASISLKEVSFVIWDEADRLMEDPTMSVQMREISSRLPETRQTALFSATLPKALAEFAQAGLRNPLLIRLDIDSKLSPDLQTYFLQTQTDTKDAALLVILNKIIKTKENTSTTSAPPLTVIFAATKHHVEYLQELLNAYNMPCTYIYGALDQTARKIAIENFRSGRKPILIVTDVAARGIDVPLLDNVINYDFPSSPKLFVHRVGRVARAGRSGRAFSLLAPDELPFIFDLQLFLGKSVVPAIVVNENNKMVTGKEKEKGSSGDSSNMLILGEAPQVLVDEEQEGLVRTLSMNGTIESLKEVMMNACKLYKKTRPFASPESHRRSKAFNDQYPVTGIHPLFISILGTGLLQQASILQAIQGYKSKSSHLSLARPNFKFGQKLAGSADDKKQHDLQDKDHYLKYRKSDATDESAYSITNGFAEQARRAVFDLSGTTIDDPSQKEKRKSNGRGGNDQRKKMIRTEIGTRVPGSFKSDVYDKWKAKTHLDIQRVGELESDMATKRAQGIVSSTDERKRWRGKRLANQGNKKKGKPSRGK